ncbi:STAS domain-containing protein [Roseovarius sp. LXJ103]|uniref:STAS domain-containing protein n=1 Tax=Roseovarius carneus TaxID=2853164 RepID=UPI000D60DEF4|nr:STAS domain-containing protein [Roseovarius carneus]MBZ8118486.1 STAS domain-containing protein [Roseovarius carneus]PWE35816.1 anti-sigma factor antagonist [Pelagicola sp. LXJ1103]
MDLSSTVSGHFTIITVNATRIDSVAAIQFKDAMRAATDTAVGTIVLDLGHVGFIDSSGLGAVVASMKQLGAGQQLDIASLTPDVAKVFRLTRMDSIFRIHDSLDALPHAKAG